ncbi:hypothetical protein [Rhizobium halophytocola]|uniref:Uncharacterized protein n=1 Tax=Rhizobium halophytocola TaxID=735519 RepID=A0ABS4DYN9_9HYPH|nr:hypothetical protein [Rhizobium halophytocola]MBP1850803.1 hypothetical protein [Rhizobium halophytocola]
MKREPYLVVIASLLAILLCAVVATKTMRHPPRNEHCVSGAQVTTCTMDSLP